MTGHPWLTLGVLIGAAAGAWSMSGKVGRVRRGLRGGGFFQLDGKEGLLNGGGSAYGKAD